MAADIHSQTGHTSENHGTGNGSNGAAARTAARPDSWKDIAAYFQRDIRTVQLWEKKEGLPIHRHGHKGHSSVYAYPEELDAWLQTRARGREAARESQAEEHRMSRRGWWLAAGVLLVVAASSFLVWRQIERRPEPLAAQRLAVLPFSDLSSPQSAARQDFLADGLTEALITDLGRSGQVAVMSSRSTMQYRGRRDSGRAIGEQLHATLILDGTVAREGNTVRVTAQLLDAREGRQLWAASYSSQEASVLSLQDEVAAQIATDVIHAVTRAAH
ncbi:MAG: hypothetical protein WCA44_12660 [Acidobacteriaceae bacterium]|jgi:TolB-like protein